MALKIVFMGTPAFSVPTLSDLVEAGHRIAAVYTQPPRPGGRRGLVPVKSAVHQASELLGLEVRTPIGLRNTADQQGFIALKADVAVVVAYGLILPRPILEGTRLGCYNGHASLLPRWRGAAPIQRAIMAGDAETGVTIMKMDEGLDTGPMALTKTITIAADMTSGELHDIMMVETGRQMCEAMRRLEHGVLDLAPQPASGATYARKIDKTETQIDFARPAASVHNHIRALAPRPGGWTMLDIDGREERIKLLGSTLDAARPAAQSAPGTIVDDDLSVACAEGSVRLTRLQRAGGKPMDAKSFLHGLSRRPGRFG